MIFYCNIPSYIITAGAGAKVINLGYNVSCIKHQAQYFIGDEEKMNFRNYFVCGNCSRKYGTAMVKDTNLVVIIIEKDCNGDCPDKNNRLLHEPTPDILYYTKRPSVSRGISVCKIFWTHVPVFLGLAGIILEILCSKFAFVANFHPANKSPNLKSVA